MQLKNIKSYFSIVGVVILTMPVFFSLLCLHSTKLHHIQLIYDPCVTKQEVQSCFILKSHQSNAAKVLKKIHFPDR